MKKLELRNGIYTVFRPLYYVCKVFGLASYSYVADRRNKRITTDYGYLNYMFTVIWLIVYTVGFSVHILDAYGFDKSSQTLFFVYVLYTISAYTSTIIVVVWVSIIKRKGFLEIIENISKVDNKIRYTPQEETYMNRKVMFNIFSEIILLTVIQCSLIIYNIYQLLSEGYYTIMLVLTGIIATYTCNVLFLFQYLNLVFTVKQRYSHLNKSLNNWINGTFSRPICSSIEKKWCMQSDRTVDHVIITPICVSNYGNFEGTVRQADIRLLRQIYSELYDTVCLINDTYGIPVLATICWILSTVICSLYGTLFPLKEWVVTDIAYAITCSALVFKVTLFCHTATNEARTSSILVQKLLLFGKYRIECVEELKMFSLQLQVMTNQYTACGFFSLNLRLFTAVVNLIVSYIVIMIQIK